MKLSTITEMVRAALESKYQGHKWLVELLRNREDASVHRLRFTFDGSHCVACIDGDFEHAHHSDIEEAALREAKSLFDCHGAGEARS